MNATNETPAGGPGLENFDLVSEYLNSTVNRFLSGAIQPHELQWPLPLFYNEAYRHGNIAAQPRVDRAERAADIYYDLAFNGDEARKRHAEMLKAFDVTRSRKRKADNA